MNRMSLLHRVGFWFSWHGFRGSQFVWAILEGFKRLPDSKVIQLPNTFPCVIKEKDWISRTIYQGTYERSLLYFLNSLTLSNLYVDIGANIGVTLWHGLRNSRSGVVFIAIEPSKQCIASLIEVTSRLDCEGLVLKYAIGDRDGIQTMYGIENELHSGGASLKFHAGLKGRSEKVEVRSLDSITERYFKGLPVSLLKIDTEGYESEVIRGANKLLESGKIEIIVIEVSPNFGDVSYLREFAQLLGQGYLWFALEETGKLRRKVALRRVSLEQSLSRTLQWNLVVFRTDVFESYCTENNRALPGCQGCI